MELDLVGYISRVKGLKGDMVVHTMDIGDIEILENNELFIGYSKQFAKNYIVNKWKKMNTNNYILNIKGVDSIELAYKFKENGVYIQKLKENDFEIDIFENNLIDFEVINKINKNKIGKVKEIISNPAHNLLIVNTDKGEMPIPFIKEFIKRVSHKYKRIYVELLDGFDEIIK